MRTLVTSLVLAGATLVGATGIVDVAKVSANGNIASFDFNLLPQRSLLAFGTTFSGPVTVASGDVNGDGHPEIVVGAGAGNSPRVRVFDGVSGALLRDFFAYAPGFTGGVRVAAQDVNEDGYDDIITGNGPGAVAQVKVFSGQNNAAFFNFIPDPAVTGGIYVAGATHGPGPRTMVVVGFDHEIKAFDLSGNLMRSITPYSGYTGGVRVATGDVNGDGFDDFVTGVATGAPPHVKVFNGQTGALIHSFFAFNPTFTGGVAVATGDINGDGKADILVGTASGAGTKSAFDGVTANLVGSFLPFGAAYMGGIDVGADNEHIGFPLRVSLNGAPVGTALTIWTPDLDNLKDGPVPLTRLYPANKQVSVTAQAYLYSGNNNLYFDRWELDGSLLTTSRTASVTQNQAHSLVGTYLPGLDISIDSNLLGVPTTVYKLDVNGASSGSTPFGRTYKQGTMVGVSTPLIVAPKSFFRRWDLDSAPWKATPTVTVPISQSRMLVSIYETGCKVDVQSNVQGVPMQVWTRDRAGLVSGNTPFVRIYAVGDRVSLTAPATAGGKTFSKWSLNGAAQPVGLKTVTIPSIAIDTTLAATYVP